MLARNSCGANVWAVNYRPAAGARSMPPPTLETMALATSSGSARFLAKNEPSGASKLDFRISRLGVSPGCSFKNRG